jgi:hypothetical protein
VLPVLGLLLLMKLTGVILFWHGQETTRFGEGSLMEAITSN